MDMGCSGSSINYARLNNMGAQVNDSMDKIKQLNKLAQNLLRLTIDKVSQFEQRRNPLILRYSLSENLPSASISSLKKDLKDLGNDINAFQIEVDATMKNLKSRVQPLLSAAVGSQEFVTSHTEFTTTLDKVQGTFKNSVSYKTTQYYDSNKNELVDKPDVIHCLYELERRDFSCCTIS